jgi:hypothetical protein
MKRSKRLGRRYIRTMSDVLRNAFLKPRFVARVMENVMRNNALLQKLMARGEV